MFYVLGSKLGSCYILIVRDDNLSSNRTDSETCPHLIHSTKEVEVMDGVT